MTAGTPVVPGPFSQPRTMRTRSQLPLSAELVGLTGLEPVC